MRGRFIKFVEIRHFVERYCKANGLDFSILLSNPVSSGTEHYFFCYHDKSRGSEGLMDSVPMPVMLKVFRTDKGFRIEETENTNRLLRQKATA